MIEGLKPYAEYKESGLPWLGKVPARWRMVRLKTVLREKDARSTDGKGLLLSLSRARGLIARSDMTDKIHSARTLVGYKLYKPGEIVMNRMQAWSGMFGAGSKPGLVSPDYAVFKLLGDDLVSLILARLKTPDLVSQFALDSKGIGSGFNRLYSDKFGAITISLPPPDEQAAIVRFLDHANRKIDGFIRAKRKLIGLLNEQKQAIIHRAVTRGLHPDVPLKPSGITWLGDIPMHWRLVPNRAFLNLRKELVGIRSSEYTLLSLTLRGVIARDMVNPTGKFPAEFNAYQVVKPNDLIFCLFDIDETPRGVGLSRLHGMITGAYTVFEARTPEIAEYLYLFYLAMDGEKCLKPLYTGLRKTIPKARFLGTKTPIPPEHERAAIIAHVGERNVHLTTAIARTEREIALMQEYRTRLTADLVTGKLDVREAAAKLPEVETDTPTAPGESFEEVEMEENDE